VPVDWSSLGGLGEVVRDRMARPDFVRWLAHVRAAAARTRPVRLAGSILTLEAGTGRVLSKVDTATMPDRVIYKPCSNRRATVCPACSQRSGEVHTRVVKRHTCGRRQRCDCRPEPCHARREHPTCPHGVRLMCFTRHATDPRLGTPLCLDCYDHAAQVVWNLQATELWRRTTIAINRSLRRFARQRGIPFHSVAHPVTSNVRRLPPFRLSFGKAAEMQRRAVVHFHAIIRLDGNDPAQPGRGAGPAGRPEHRRPGRRGHPRRPCDWAVAAWEKRERRSATPSPASGPGGRSCTSSWPTRSRTVSSRPTRPPSGAAVAGGSAGRSAYGVSSPTSSPQRSPVKPLSTTATNSSSPAGQQRGPLGDEPDAQRRGRVAHGAVAARAELVPAAPVVATLLGVPHDVASFLCGG
jgi:hypothetical protein